MREMKSAPEKIVMLEVAMVRLVKPELDSTYEALDERLTRLERDGARQSAPAPAPPPSPVLRPIGTTTPGRHPLRSSSSHPMRRLPPSQQRASP